MPKIQIFLRQIFHHALPMPGVLFRRGLNINPVCPLSMNDIDSMDHLLLECSMSRRVLEGAVQHGWISNGLLGIGTNLCDQLQRLGSHPKHRRALPKISFLLWSIWKGRHNAVFRNEFFKPLSCLVSAKKASAEWRILEYR